jgi:hypothetical protein
MSPIDAGFQQRLRRIVEKEIELISSALMKGVLSGKIKATVNPTTLAFYILASIEGSFSIAKSLQNIDILHASFDQLISFLNSLKNS